MNVYIPGTGFATQGPAPDGFHVPSKKEWEEVVSIMGDLGLGESISNYKTYLYLPTAYSRNWYNGEKATDINSYYWCSEGLLYEYGNRGYGFSTYSIEVSSNVSTSGEFIRTFKDMPVTPDSNWTALYSDKIYHNSTLGLISLSSDGTNWITIADKSLGATTVYNNGDTLSESNCGKYYQRGNNYGFPFSGSITTSSTKVNASTYGPGNYYLSSIFIYGTTSPLAWGWDSSNNLNLRGGVDGNVQVVNELKNAYIGEYTVPYLCFTANTANSTIKLTKTGSPTSVTLETSTDGSTWTSYTIGNTITLSNIGDKVYWRNTSESDTGFTIDNSNRYTFVMTGSIAGSGDINYLLNKNSTTTLSSNCYRMLFYNCTSLTTAPSLPATTLADSCYDTMFYGCTGLTTAPALPATTLAVMCYYYMFYGCTNLTTLPKLPATTLTDSCYYYMFYNCSKIKLSTSKTGEYQTAYRIPTTGTGTTAFDALFGMFSSTGGTFKSTPSINTTYYTSNTVV